jgi:hypothetical protein
MGDRLRYLCWQVCCGSDDTAFCQHNACYRSLLFFYCQSSLSLQTLRPMVELDGYVAARDSILYIKSFAFEGVRLKVLIHKIMDSEDQLLVNRHINVVYFHSVDLCVCIQARTPAVQCRPLQYQHHQSQK